MRYTNRQYAEALYDTLEKAGPDEYKAVVARFAQTIVKHRKTNQIKDVAASFEELLLAKKGAVKAKITTASASEQAFLVEMLKSECEIEKKIDPSLIAGAEITIGDTRTSSSLKARLADLKKAII